VFGCGSEPLELPAIRYRTEHLRIGTDFTAEACAGSIDRLEEHVQRLERLLEIDVTEPIELYWFAEDPPCFTDHAAGCYNPETGVVLTEYWAARHELAHAVSYLWGNPDRFYAEGVAQAFSGERSQFGTALPSASLGLATRVPTQDAAHFMRWLYERDGAAPLRTLFERSAPYEPRSAERAFAAAYGSTIWEAERTYYAEAPEFYPGLTWCSDDVDVLPWQGEYWTHSIELDCAATHTRGAQTMLRSVAFDVERDGPYTFEIEAPGRAYITSCQTEVIEMGGRDVAEWGAVGEEPGGSFYILGGWIESGAAVELDLYAGRHRVALEVPTADRVTLRVYLGPRLTGGATEF
jgi:hypothetical protein